MSTSTASGAVLRVAALQHATVPGDVDANLAVVERSARAAASQGAHLLVTPEMFVTGYNVGDALPALAALDLDARVSSIARETGVAIVAGLPEAHEGSIYNTALFVDESGERLAHYRKTHLFGDLDRALFRRGEEAPPLIDYRGLRLALLICYDVEFPETVRAAALQGADAVLVPTAQMEPFAFIAESVIPVRAWESQIHVVYADHVGVENGLRYVGRSSIAAPDGTVLSRAGGEESALLVADLRADLVASSRAANPYLLDLRHELYEPGAARR
jgi:predicted amidohydrolase